MRTLLAATLLALAALAAVPPASAAEVAQPLPVCVPPASGNGVCIGTIDGNPCAWTWLGPSFNAVCADRSGDLLICDNDGCVSVRDVVGSSIAQPDPVCVPPGVESFAVCVGLVNGDVCAWVWLGPSQTIVCLSDLLRASTSAQQLPIECGSSVGVCVWTHTPGGTCVGVHVGLQGAGACVDTEPVGVRVCSSMRTFLYDGNCPTDGLAADLTA